MPTPARVSANSGKPEIFKLLVQVGLLFSAQILLTATLPICIVVVYIVQRVYLRTSRQLRLLDLESQAAVFSSFLESVSLYRNWNEGEDCAC